MITVEVVGEVEEELEEGDAAEDEMMVLLIVEVLLVEVVEAETETGHHLKVADHLVTELHPRMKEKGVSPRDIGHLVVIQAVDP